MNSKIKTDIGIISIENDVIARMAGMAAMECYGVVGMAAKNVRDGIVQLLKVESLSKGVKLDAAKDGLSISLHIIVEYGTNIPAITETLLSNVKFVIEEKTGIPINEVNIFVEGVRVD
jgi:uncharacterized alkaline shock family protein YloU